MNYLKVITDKELSQSEKILMIYFLHNYKDSGIHVSYKIIGRELNMTRPTLIKAVNNLEAKGLISKENNSTIFGGVGANTYKISTRKYM